MATVQQYSFAKSKIRVLVLENIHQSAVDIFKSETFAIETVPKALSENELIDRIRGVHLLGIRSKTKVTKAVIEAADKLLAIGCFCIGTDQVDLATAEKHGIPVFNAPFSNTRSVAELVIGEIIALSRKLSDKSRDAHKGMWSKSAAGCAEVRGKTLGIIGYGHIGSQLSVLAEALGMKVVYYDVVSVLPIGNGKALGSMDEVLATADFVSLHVPKAPTTNNLISGPELAKMKKGSYLINASRGTVVDIDALASALKDGHLAGAAVDVFPSEPAKNGPGFESPLCGLENVILTPHVGGSTAEAQQNIGIEVSTALIKHVNLGTTIGAVNFPNLDLPISFNCHRILNAHQNVPGVLTAINGILSETRSNVTAQMLGTSNSIGYIIIDLNKETSVDTKAAISNLETSISTRILF
ncbi:D-3-phosphoglycerate dehydrogenase [Gracilaria domingensis]|nr:D-3-phosphoglycerate dehydrogenase [Gracilaria domingensis]